MVEDKRKHIKKRVDQLHDLEKGQTRSAIALSYDPKKDAAPTILATGKGVLAAEILRIAEENKIPLYEDPALAELLSKLELDVNIPAELYTLVAEVLAFVYQLEQLAAKRMEIQRQVKENPRLK